MLETIKIYRYIQEVLIFRKFCSYSHHNLTLYMSHTSDHSQRHNNVCSPSNQMLYFLVQKAHPYFNRHILRKKGNSPSFFADLLNPLHYCTKKLLVNKMTLQKFYYLQNFSLFPYRWSSAENLLIVLIQCWPICKDGWTPEWAVYQLPRPVKEVQITPRVKITSHICDVTFVNRSINVLYKLYAPEAHVIIHGRG